MPRMILMGKNLATPYYMYSGDSAVDNRWDGGGAVWGQQLGQAPWPSPSKTWRGGRRGRPWLTPSLLFLCPSRITKKLPPRRRQSRLVNSTLDHHGVHCKWVQVVDIRSNIYLLLVTISSKSWSSSICTRIKCCMVVMPTFFLMADDRTFLSLLM